MEVMMKKVTLNICMLAAIIIGLTVISASAQTTGRFTTHIPFEFTVGQTNFNAGEYTVKVVNPESDRIALSITSTDGRQSRIVLTTPKMANPKMENAKLVFNRYGGQYVLAEMDTPAFAAEIRGARVAGDLAQRRINTDPSRETVALLWQGR
jgi:hypothetical protein